jgi:hypothetical protein
MKRRLLNLLTALSLLLYVAAGAAAVAGRSGGFSLRWLRSADWVGNGAEGDQHVSYAAQGLSDRLIFVRETGSSIYPRDWDDSPVHVTRRSQFFCSPLGPWQGFVATASPTTYPLHFGFAWMNDEPRVGSSHSRLHFHALIVPPWLPMALTALLPAHAIVRVTRRRLDPARGLCTRCGYNLTGNVSGICPECGTAGTAPVGCRAIESPACSNG